MTDSARHVKLDLLIQDALISVSRGGRAASSVEEKRLAIPEDSTDRFLDGPACRRMAVVDFDPATGLPLPPPAKFRASKPGILHGTYEVDASKPQSAAALAVNAFGTVFLTVKMFEGDNALGRTVEWAFEGEQLMIVPRAGEWANAFYDRSTRSLQFFWFPGRAAGSTVYTALSRDIVAHEVGHALLDAVVPSLYDSATPESIAIHEAVADLIAILMALDSQPLRAFVLAMSGNQLTGMNAFNKIAEEFGTAQVSADGIERTALRSLSNTETRETLKDAGPHELSVLLSGIFYDTAQSIFDKRMKDELSQRPGATPDDMAAAAQRALGTTYGIFRRVILRAIDYLPPGELTFADVGRATLAADHASLPDVDVPAKNRAEVHEIRDEFAARFVTRKLATKASALNSTAPAALSVPPADVAALHDSDFVAYRWVEQHRATIGIPDDVPFTVLPRVDATKGRSFSLPPQRELIVKVGWSLAEPAKLPARPAKQRLVPTGATVSIHWETGRCLALVTSEILVKQHAIARDRLAARLIADGLADGDESPGRFRMGTSGDVVTISASHRLLHLEGWEE